MVDITSTAEMGILMGAVVTLEEVIKTASKEKDIKKATTSAYEVNASYTVVDYNNKCELCVNFDLTPKEKSDIAKIAIKLYETEIPILANVSDGRIIASMSYIDNIEIIIELLGGGIIELDYSHNEQMGTISVNDTEFDIENDNLLDRLDYQCMSEFLVSVMKRVGRIDAGDFYNDNTVMQYEYTSHANPSDTKSYETHIDDAGSWSFEQNNLMYADFSVYGEEVAKNATQKMLMRINEQDTWHDILIV